MTTVRLFGVCGLLLAAGAAAQEPAPAATGAKPGDIVPSTFRAYIVADNRFPPKKSPPMTAEDRDPRDRSDKMHDPVVENGLSPVVAVFVRADVKGLGPDRGVGKLLARVNQAVPKYRADRLAAFAMFLKVEGTPRAVPVKDATGAAAQVELDAEYPDDEKRDEYAGEVRDFANKVQAPNVVFGLAPVKSKATDAWGLGAADEVTVVIYNRMRVANRWVFKADGPTDAQIDEVVAATEEMITGVKKKKATD